MKNKLKKIVSTILVLALITGCFAAMPGISVQAFGGYPGDSKPLKLLANQAPVYKDKVATNLLEAVYDGNGANLPGWNKISGNGEKVNIIVNGIKVGYFEFDKKGNVADKGFTDFLKIEIYDNILTLGGKAEVGIRWHCSKYYAYADLSAPGIYWIPQLMQDNGKIQSFNQILLGTSYTPPVSSTGSLKITADVTKQHEEITIQNFYERTIQDFYERTIQNFYERLVQDFYERTVQDFYSRDVQDFYARDIQDFYERTVQDFYERTVQDFYSRDIQKFYERTVQEFYERTVQDFYEQTVQDFYERTVQDFYERTVQDFYERYVQDFYSRDIQKFYSRDVQDFYSRDVQNFYERTAQEFYERTVQDFYSRDVQDFFSRDVQAFYERTVQNFYEQTVQEFYERTVQEFYERTVQEFYEQTVQDFYERTIKEYYIPVFEKQTVTSKTSTLVSRLTYSDNTASAVPTNGGAFNNGHTYVEINVEEARNGGYSIGIADSSKNANGKTPPSQYNVPIGYNYNVDIDGNQLVISFDNRFISSGGIGAYLVNNPSQFPGNAPKHVDANTLTIDLPAGCGETVYLYFHMQGGISWYAESEYRFMGWRLNETADDCVLVYTEIGEYKLVNTEIGEYKLVNTEIGTYKLINTVISEYELVKTEASKYELVKIETSPYELIDTEFGKYEFVKTEFGSYALVDTKLGDYVLVKTVTGEYELVKTVTGAYELVDTKIGEYELVKTVTGDYKLVKTEISGYDITAKISIVTAGNNLNQMTISRIDVVDFTPKSGDNPVYVTSVTATYGNFVKQGNGNNGFGELTVTLTFKLSDGTTLIQSMFVSGIKWGVSNIRDFTCTHGEYTRVNTVVGDYELVKIVTGDYVLVKTVTGAYELVDTKLSGYELVKTELGKYKLVDTKISEYELVNTHIGDYVLVKTVTGEYELVKTVAGAYELVDTKIGEYELVKTVTGDYKLVKTEISGYAVTTTVTIVPSGNNLNQLAISDVRATYVVSAEAQNAVNTVTIERLSVSYGNLVKQGNGNNGFGELTVTLTFKLSDGTSVEKTELVSGIKWGANTVKDFTYGIGEYALVRTVVSDYALVKTVIGDYKLVDTVYGDYTFVKTEYGDYKLVNTVIGDYKLVDTVYGDYTFVKTEYGDYKRVNTTYGDYELSRTEVSDYKLVKTDISEYKLVNTIKDSKTVTATYNVVFTLVVTDAYGNKVYNGPINNNGEVIISNLKPGEYTCVLTGTDIGAHTKYTTVVANNQAHVSFNNIVVKGDPVYIQPCDVYSDVRLCDVYSDRKLADAYLPDVCALIYLGSTNPEDPESIRYGHYTSPRP